MPHVEWNPFKKVGNVRCTAAKCKRFCSDTAGNFDNKKNHIISSIAIKFIMIRALRIILHVQNKFNSQIVSSSFNEKSWVSSHARTPCFLNTTKPKTLDRVARMVFVICSRAIYTLIAWMIGVMEATEYLFDIWQKEMLFQNSDHTSFAWKYLIMMNTTFFSIFANSVNTDKHITY